MRVISFRDARFAVRGRLELLLPQCDDRVEPSTSRFESQRSIQLSYGRGPK